MMMAVLDGTFVEVVSLGCNVVKIVASPSIGLSKICKGCLETLVTFAENLPCWLLPNTKLFCGVMVVLDVKLPKTLQAVNAVEMMMRLLKFYET